MYSIMCIFKIGKLIVNFIQPLRSLYTVPRTELVGDSDRYVKAGSTVVLRCIIRGALEPPSYIIWYHGSQQLLPDNQRGFKMQMGKGTTDSTDDTHSVVRYFFYPISNTYVVYGCLFCTYFCFCLFISFFTLN